MKLITSNNREQTFSLRSLLGFQHRLFRSMLFASVPTASLKTSSNKSVGLCLKETCLYHFRIVYPAFHSKEYTFC
jgi:hypothetical protein